MTHENLQNVTPQDLGQPQVSLGESLGLPDGQFVVARNVYDNPDAKDRKVVGTVMEQGGWVVTSSYEVADEQGAIHQMVRIDNPTTGANKPSVALEKLNSWQQIEIDPDRTLTRAEIVALKAQNLGSVAVATEQSKQVEHHEGNSRLTVRQQEIFAPFIENETVIDEHMFDDMLNPNSDWSNKSIEDAAVRSEGRAPSDESLSRARQMLEAPALDYKAREIIIRNTRDARNKDDVIKIIRENAEVRNELASYFMQKVSHLSGIPARIRANSMKSTGFKGYEGKPQPTSQEFAALLALSMLDGTFKPESVADGIVKSEDGEVLLGQHRYAAEAILFF